MTNSTTIYRKCILVFQSYDAIRGLCNAWEVVGDTKSTYRLASCRTGERQTVGKDMVRIGVETGDVNVIPRENREGYV